MKTTRRPAGRITLLLLAALLTLTLAACGGASSAAPAAAPEAAPAAQSAAAESAAAESAARVIAMADQPQRITPSTFTGEFVPSGEAYQLIDVRTPEEFASGHIEGAINIPVQELQQRMDEVSSDEPVVLYCRSGNRSNQAAQILDGAGYSGVYDLGGVIAWQQAGLPLETGCTDC
jgi:rhodanese-related sulfurtransferase